MDTEKIVKFTIGVIVAVLVSVTVLVPVVDAGMRDNGDPVTYYNIGRGITYREAEDGDTLKVLSVWENNARTNTLYLNDEKVTTEASVEVTWDVLLMSDCAYAQINASNNTAMGTYCTFDSESVSLNPLTGANSEHPTRYIQFEFTDGSIAFSYVDGDTTVTSDSWDYNWAYIPCNIDDGATMYSTTATTGRALVKVSDPIILCGAYTTGDLDTFYYYEGGTLTVLDDSYTGCVDIDMSLKDGTTDVYNATVEVTISDGTNDESFNPYRMLVPYQIDGHTSSGTVYTLLSVVPILLLAGIVLSAATVLIKKRM